MCCFLCFLGPKSVKQNKKKKPCGWCWVLGAGCWVLLDILKNTSRLHMGKICGKRRRQPDVWDAGRMNDLFALAAALPNGSARKTLLLRHCTDHQLHLNPPPPPPLLPQMAYKPWLCAQFFPTAWRSCKQKVPCHQYCLEVQQSCPFILPDNDDLIHGGSPSFICTGQSCRRVVPRSLPVCDVESCETLCARVSFLHSLALLREEPSAGEGLSGDT